MAATTHPGVGPGRTLRSPTPGDAEAILALVQAYDTALLGRPDVTLDDIQDFLHDPRRDLAHDAWVVVDDAGRLELLAGVLDRAGGGSLEGELTVHPDAPATLARLGLTLTERRAAAIAARNGVPAATLDHWALRPDTRGATALADAGFARVRTHARMHVDFAGPVAAPALAAPLAIDVVAATEDGRRLVHRLKEATFGEHFGHVAETYEQWWTRTSASVVTDPRQWWVLRVGEAPVGFAMGSNQLAGENGGWVHNLGVLPAYRGRGLGRLLLQHCFASFAAAGRIAAGLGVDVANATGALALYESAGMRPLFQVDTWRKQVPAGQASPA